MLEANKIQNLSRPCHTLFRLPASLTECSIIIYKFNADDDHFEMLLCKKVKE